MVVRLLIFCSASVIGLIIFRQLALIPMRTRVSASSARSTRVTLAVLESVNSFVRFALIIYAGLYLLLVVSLWRPDSVSVRDIDSLLARARWIRETISPIQWPLSVVCLSLAFIIFFSALITAYRDRDFSTSPPASRAMRSVGLFLGSPAARALSKFKGWISVIVLGSFFLGIIGSESATVARGFEVAAANIEIALGGRNAFNGSLPTVFELDAAVECKQDRSECLNHWARYFARTAAPKISDGHTVSIDENRATRVEEKVAVAYRDALIESAKIGSKVDELVALEAPEVHETGAFSDLAADIVEASRASDGVSTVIEPYLGDGFLARLVGHTVDDVLASETDKLIADRVRSTSTRLELVKGTKMTRRSEVKQDFRSSTQSDSVPCFCGGVFVGMRSPAACSGPCR